MRAADLSDVLIALDHGKRRALHRLREIAQTSRALAELVLGDKQDRDSASYEKLRQILPLGLHFEDLVTLTNLAED
jgi:hypothetical protein